MSMIPCVDAVHVIQGSPPRRAGAGFSFGAGLVKQRILSPAPGEARRSSAEALARKGSELQDVMVARQGSGFSSKSALDRSMIGSDGEASHSFFRSCQS